MDADNNVYEILDGEAYLVEAGKVKKHLEIPAEVTAKNGTKYPVVEIGEGVFRKNTSVTSVVIPNSVKSIGSEAFYDCKNLSSVTIPNSVKTIGIATFEGCSSLASVIIPNSVTTIKNIATKSRMERI